MSGISSTDSKTRMFTTHGGHKYQGKWARVNNRIALVYTEGRGDQEKVVGYTNLDDMMQIIASGQLPDLNLNY